MILLTVIHVEMMRNLLKIRMVILIKQLSLLVFLNFMFLITADRSLQIIDKLSAASSNRILSYDESFLNTTNNDNLLDGT